MASFTLIEPMTGIGWHNLQLLMATGRASDLGAGNYFSHLASEGVLHSFFAGHIKSAIDTVNIKIKAV